MTGPYLTPSLVIGLGAWGRSVAGAMEAALRERSPALARACPVLLLDDADAAAPELIRAHLRAGRLADVVRALEREGLMQLDPVIAPTTHVYLVGGCGLGAVAGLVEQAAAELKIAVALVGLVERSDSPWPDVAGFPVYVTEPATSHGLMLDPVEYRDAMAEVLLAAVQPGGSAILSGGGGGGAGGASAAPGTVGVAWLAWSPASLRQELARRLGRDALRRCLEGGEPARQSRAVLKETAAWRARSPERRGAALLHGLPFGPDFTPPRSLFGAPARRRRLGQARQLRRAAAVLERKRNRWDQVLERNAQAQARTEAEALEESIAALLAGGPDGMARARALAGQLGQEPAEIPLGREVPRVGPLLRKVEQAESAPPAKNVVNLLSIVFLLGALLWLLVHGRWPSLLAYGLILGAVAAAYALWRPWNISQAAAAAWAALDARAAALVEVGVQQRWEWLDSTMADRCARLAVDLDRAQEALAGLCRALGPQEPAQPRSALSFPLLDEAAIGPVYLDLQPLAPEVGAYLAKGGALRAWRDPADLLARVEALTADFLAGRAPLDPAQLATRAYGDRLAVRLQAAVRGLMEWSRPMLTSARPLPEGERWLLWPEGLPCPPVPGEVQVLPGSRSCAAVVTVIHTLPAGVRPLGRRTAGETSA